MIQFSLFSKPDPKRPDRKPGWGLALKLLVPGGCRSSERLRGKDSDLDATACFARLSAFTFIDQLLFSQTYHMDSVDRDIVGTNKVGNHRVCSFPAELIVVGRRSGLICEALNRNKVALQ